MHACMHPCTPHGLLMQLELTIDNYNIEFLNKWHTVYKTRQLLSTKHFSKTFMKEVVEFCKHVKTETYHQITRTTQELKNNIGAQQITSIEAQITDNVRKIRNTTHLNTATITNHHLVVILNSTNNQREQQVKRKHMLA